MTEDNFLTYQKFRDEIAAHELTDLLLANGIDFLLENDSLDFDPSFANNGLNKEFKVKLKKQDFGKVDELLFRISAEQLNEVDKNYYLFEFSDQELMEILVKNDEWGKFDYLLAQKILKDRGKDVNEQLLETLRKIRIEELAKPESSQNSWILAGYLLAFLGGFLACFIGWHLFFHKKTLPNGDSVYAYRDEDRKHGKIILILGTIFLTLWIVINIYLENRWL